MDKLTKEQWGVISYALGATFQDTDIEWRVGSTNKDKTKCMPLAYLTARATMERLDRVVGPGNWSTAYSSSTLVDGNGKQISGVECRLTVCGVTKADVGVPSMTEPMKGMYSDSLKRAAVQFGIGRYLYDMRAQWVAYTGKSYAPFGDTAFQREHWKNAGAPAPISHERLGKAWDAAMELGQPKQAEGTLDNAAIYDQTDDFVSRLFPGEADDRTTAAALVSAVVAGYPTVTEKEAQDAIREAYTAMGGSGLAGNTTLTYAQALEIMLALNGYGQ
jgi:hypothetical protein